MVKVLPYLCCLLGSIASCAFLFVLLLTSAQPHALSGYAMPILGLINLGTVFLAVLTMRKQIGNVAFAQAPLCIFLGSIPIWTIMEVTIV